GATETGAAANAAKYGVVRAQIRRIGAQGQWKDAFDRRRHLRELELVRHDANHEVRAIVEEQGRSRRRGVSSKPRAPARVRDHDDVGSTWNLFVIAEHAAGRRPPADHAEEVGR